MNERYIAGWNQRIMNPLAKLPRDNKINKEYLNGYYDCNKIINAEIAVAISEYRNPIYPTLL